MTGGCTLSEPRTYARPRTFDIECPRCGRLHVVAHPHRSTTQWDHKRSRLVCPCGKRWIVGLALWELGGVQGEGRPLDQIPSRQTLLQLRGIVKGTVERRKSGLGVRQITRSLAIVKAAACTCQWHRPPLQFVKVKGSEVGCAIHGGGDDDD